MDACVCGSQDDVAEVVEKGCVDVVRGPPELFLVVVIGVDGAFQGGPYGFDVAGGGSSGAPGEVLGGRLVCEGDRPRNIVVVITLIFTGKRFVNSAKSRAC